jgi:ketosteroid isomerase-like protein
VGGVNTSNGNVIAALYAEDGVHEDIPSGMTASGRREIADLVNGALTQFDDITWTPVSARQVGDLAVLEYAFSATDLESGKPLSFRGVIVFELDGDQIRRSADYYDVATILGGLGLLDLGEESAATPAP